MMVLVLYTETDGREKNMCIMRTCIEALGKLSLDGYVRVK
jgi:hypothetical protein